MSEALSERASNAMRWRTIQLAGVQLIYFTRLLVLAKMLAPDDFGLVAIAAAVIGVMMRVSDVGMIPALIQRQEVSLVQQNAAWTVGLLRALLIALLLMFVAPTVAQWYGEPRAAAIIQVLALRPVIEAMASIGIARFTRDLRFRDLALIYVPGALVDMITAVATASWLGVWALVCGALAGAATTTVLSYIIAPHRPAVVFRLAAIGSLVRFGRWVMLTGIVVLAATTTLELVLSRNEGAAALGLYVLSRKVAFLATDAVGTIVGSVAFPLFAGLQNSRHRIIETFRKLLTVQALFLLPVYGILIVLAPSLEEALGARWGGTAAVVQVLALASVIGLFGDSLEPLLLGIGRPQRWFLLVLLQMTILVVAASLLVTRYGATGAAVAWLVANAVATVVGLAWIAGMSKGDTFVDKAPVSVLAALAAAGVAAFVAGGLAAPLAGLTALLVGGALGLASAMGVILIFDYCFKLRLAELVRWLRGKNDAPAASVS